jgi:putative FmdB family regulatory protein
MPIYEAVCKDCGVEAEYSRPVSECMNVPACVSCGELMHKVIRTAAKGFVTGKFDPFISPVDGSLITSQREMQEHNRRNNVVNMADGYSDEAVKSGACATPPPKVDINDIKADIAEATQMVANGYKPITEVYDGD